jgi:hypothetical protein
MTRKPTTIESPTTAGMSPTTVLRIRRTNCHHRRQRNRK